jgi:type II secretory pathway pseudopilin PulG
MLKKNEKGFTVIEAIVMAVVLAIVGVFFFIQKNELETTAHDQSRKTDINNIYYNLTEVFYKEKNYYPPSVDNTILHGIDPDSFTDDKGIAINAPDSKYSYEGINCNIDGHCKSFRLATTLEKEAEYIRQPG